MGAFLGYLKERFYHGCVRAKVGLRGEGGGGRPGDLAEGDTVQEGHELGSISGTLVRGAQGGR